MDAELLPGVGPDIGTAMIATVAATVFITGALKGVVGLGFSTGSIVVFSLLYGLESALCLLVAPTVATNLWQGAAGGYARALIARFWPALAAIVPAGWPRAVARPRLPQIRTCPTKASGSSNDGLAAQRYTLCTTRALGRG